MRAVLGARGRLLGLLVVLAAVAVAVEASVPWRQDRDELAPTEALWPGGAGLQPWQQCLVDARVQRLVLPNETAAFNALRFSFNHFYNRKPGAIVVANSTGDVQKALLCVHAFVTSGGTLHVAIRSGGHSYAGFSTIDTGLLLDVGGLNGTLWVDTAREVVKVQAGMRNDALNTLLDKHEWVIPSGTCPTVALGGLLLGGGFGFSARMYGLLIDKLLEAEVVLANGTLVVANATHHSALFWALRGGGGGNFGVATAYTLQAAKYTGAAVRFNKTLHLPSPRAMADLAHAMQQWSLHADPRMNVAFSCAYPTKMTFDGHWLGTRREMEPFLAGSPLHNISFDVFEGKYPEFNYDYGDNVAPHMFTGSSRWIYDDAPLSLAAYEQLFVLATDILLPNWEIQFHMIGPDAAVNKVPADATAFPHRDGLLNVQFLSIFTNPDYGIVARAQMAAFDEAIVPLFRKKAVYLNYPDEFMTTPADYMEAYYGGNAARLRQIKRMYDPLNVFYFRQSIPLAAEDEDA